DPETSRSEITMAEDKQHTMPNVGRKTRQATMKKILITIATVLLVYISAYGWLRFDRHLVRGIGKWGSYIQGNSGLERLFTPAWLLERKTRSLYWRIANEAPLLGHVDWSDCRDGSPQSAPFPLFTRPIYKEEYRLRAYERTLLQDLLTSRAKATDKRGH
ncbi:MAG: hypothetical protein AAF497_26755, partial [Planctomycetota bacterium]